MDQVVKEDGTVVTDGTPVEPVVTDPKPQPGTKTDPALLLKSLQEEREEKRKLEVRIAELEAAPSTAEFSEEGKLLKKEIDDLKLTLSVREKTDMLSNVISQNPVLKDKASEFDAYLQENPGMKIETAAKAFLIENDLFEAPKPRKGLEKAGGGGRTPPSGELSIDEIDNLRTTNYRKYSDMVRKGQIKI